MTLLILLLFVIFIFYILTKKPSQEHQQRQRPEQDFMSSRSNRAGGYDGSRTNDGDYYKKRSLRDPGNFMAFAGGALVGALLLNLWNQGRIEEQNVEAWQNLSLEELKTELVDQGIVSADEFEQFANEQQMLLDNDNYDDHGDQDDYYDDNHDQNFDDHFGGFDDPFG
ncbi:hypothetical protein F9B85_09575 [Heliorestis acidaminivorans]|uniref:Uncharacterized protein n=1 Tax=Heliorestis acidaminivorans TaxID=553427 RepID=A0A6I0EQI8_9FIRM|nr:hypothetical protein [Heliorestis acidaminivorans]KAB2952394.1 hypothetical protein F9B85_09575 [Heliorestis acidaminivorans]